MKKVMILAAAGAAMLLLGSAAPPPGAWANTEDSAPEASAADLQAAIAAASAASDPFATSEPFPVSAEVGWAADPAPPPLPEPPPPPPEPPRASEALADGVLIVVSIPSQRLYVFRDGDLWDSSKVSTGRRGHETPVGTFPILQKKVHHRSNLYDDAPMPFMQRLTWDGVALHAGSVPGYPASHGCIRLPRAFAKKLYGVTGFSSTVVVVTDLPVSSAEEALETV